MENLSAKTYVIGVIPVRTGWVRKGVRCWKTDGVVRIWENKIVRPVYFDTNLDAEMYLNVLQDTNMPSLLNEDGKFPVYLQQDGAPLHYGICVRRWLDQQFPASWVGRSGPVEWPPRSPDHSPLDFYLWGHLKAMVYHEKYKTWLN
jgi:hypothetical protein